MRIASKCLIGMMALVFCAAQANAAGRTTTSAHAEVVKVKTVKKAVRKPVRHEYENVAGFRGRLHDPLYSFAAESPAMATAPHTPVITQWPMANTVWW